MTERRKLHSGGTEMRYTLVVVFGIVALFVIGCGKKQPATTVSLPPVVDAGGDQTISANQTVLLDASKSFAPDGDSLAYQWRQVSGPPVEITNGTSAQVAVTLKAHGSYVFEVRVSNGTATVADRVTVTVPNSPPVAFAGDDMTVRPNQSVILDASRSSDPNGDELTYEWRQISGPVLTIADARSVQASFTPMTFAEYSFEVSVTDGTAIMKDQVIVTVTDPLQVSATMEMVYIAPGMFLMGSPDSEPRRSTNEGPQHEVTISKGFYLGKYEVTQGQWEGVMGTRPWAGKRNVQESPDNPAGYVLWLDAQAFLGKLNAAEGTTVWRLPTEAEWEYAGRAGTTTRWSYGDDESQLGNYAWYNSTNSRDPWHEREAYAHQVGLKLPNPWGLYDMHGNVWEWVQDRYDPSYYSQSPMSDPAGPVTGGQYQSWRIQRGGSFLDSSDGVRVAQRSPLPDPNTPNPHHGFRCVRSVTP